MIFFILSEKIWIFFLARLIGNSIQMQQLGKYFGTKKAKNVQTVKIAEGEVQNKKLNKVPPPPRWTAP